MKDREQPLPSTAVVRLGSETSAAKDRSPVANIDPDRALISFKEVPITPVEANHDAGEVACGEIGGLAIDCDESPAETLNGSKNPIYSAAECD